MKPRDGESYEEWLDRAREYEYRLAMQRLAKGDDLTEVMETMSRRLLDKALHPVFISIKESAVKPYDAEKSRKEYEEKCIKEGLGKVADHVEGNLFDKNE